MEHPGESLPGWSLGYTQEGGFPYAKIETELGRFTATWYADEIFGARQAYVAFNGSSYDQSGRTCIVAPARAIGWFPADEIVGRCLLFDTTG